MGYFRHITVDSLPVEGVNIAIDENRAALRFLQSVPKEDLPEHWKRCEASQLLTTEELGRPHFDPASIKNFYEIEEVFWVVTNEIILDKTVPEYQRIWTPGVHFAFYFDPSRGLKIDPIGALAGVSQRNTAELIRHLGGIWCFDMWVRNPQAPLTECARSITTAPTTLFISNLEDLGVIQSAEYVMQGGRSKWLSLGYQLIPDRDEVEPDGTVFYTFEVLDGKTREVAEDVSWDGWRIEAVDGYAPHKRVSVTNGRGRFRVMALGLNSGESMRVKVGHRFNPSLVEAVVRIK